MMKGVKIGNYTYFKSNKKGKKLMTTVKVNGKDKIIHFGSSVMGHYKDKTGIWKELNHNDKERKKNYLSRSSGIKNKQGKITKDDPKSSNYHARKILWDA